MKNRKQLETVLYSTLGIVIMGVIFVVLNVVARPLVWRKDMTENKIYTLSEGTRRILSSLDTPVQIRFYFSRSSPSTPEDLKAYAVRVED
ncbi:MAG TPA: Gldg family protein, partial [Verrucomicrobiota bacterium]|nr:Gldg family protein [Verrucomicrobiota bacterium]